MIWEQQYSREKFLEFLHNKLYFERYAAPKPRYDDGKVSLLELGTVTTNDGKRLLVHEAIIDKGINIARNRAGLRNLVAKEIDAIVEEGAIASFHTSGRENWRLSFLAKEYIAKEGGIEMQETSTTRYTYLLGPGVQTRTAGDRLSQLDRTLALSGIKKIFSVEPLNKEFYEGLSKWYQEAKDKIYFPSGNGEAPEQNESTNLIRLVTRILFIWFLKEKDLIGQDLFDREKIDKIIHYEKESSYYKAILQNLFFATLNNKMGKRRFARKETQIAHMESKIYYEYGKNSQNPLFKISDSKAMKLFSDIPFLNGGLFECLDDATAPPTPPRGQASGWLL